MNFSYGISYGIFNLNQQSKNSFCRKLLILLICHSPIEVEVVGDPGIEPGVRLREGVTVPCHTLRPVAHYQVTVAPDVKA